MQKIRAISKIGSPDTKHLKKDLANFPIFQNDYKEDIKRIWDLSWKPKKSRGSISNKRSDGGWYWILS